MCVYTHHTWTHHTYTHHTHTRTLSFSVICNSWWSLVTPYEKVSSNRGSSVYACIVDCGQNRVLAFFSCYLTKKKYEKVSSNRGSSVYACMQIRPTQSIMYVPLQVTRFQKSILLIVQYKYLKSCSWRGSSVYACMKILKGQPWIYRDIDLRGPTMGWLRLVGSKKL